MGNESLNKIQQPFQDSIVNQLLNQFQIYDKQSQFQIKSYSHDGKVTIFQQKHNPSINKQQNSKQLIALNFQSIYKQKAFNQLQNLKNHINYYKKRAQLTKDIDNEDTNNIFRLIRFSIKNQTTNQYIYPQNNQKPVKNQPKNTISLASCSFQNIFKEKQRSINVVAKNMYTFSFLHEFNLYNLERQIRNRLIQNVIYEQKQIWSIIFYCSKAAQIMIQSGLKQPVLSPASIFMNKDHQIKVSEWEFINYYFSFESNDNLIQQEGQTFVTNDLELTINKSKNNKSNDILMKYYWPPQGLVQMQNILKLGEIQEMNKQQQLNQIKNSQVFCLGMTAIQLLTLKPYYQKGTYSQKQIGRIIYQAIQYRQRCGQPISQQLIALIVKMLQWQPTQRFKYHDIIQYIHQMVQYNPLIFGQSRRTIQIKSVQSCQHDQSTQDNINNMEIKPQISYQIQGKRDRPEDSGIMYQGTGDDYSPPNSDSQYQQRSLGQQSHFNKPNISYFISTNNYIMPLKPDEEDISQLVEDFQNDQIQNPDYDSDYEGQNIDSKYQQNLLSQSRRQYEEYKIVNGQNSIKTEKFPGQFSIYQYVPSNWQKLNTNKMSQLNSIEYNSNGIKIQQNSAQYQQELGNMKNSYQSIGRESIKQFNLKFNNKSNQKNEQLSRQINMRQNYTFSSLLQSSNNQYLSPLNNQYVNNLSTIIKQTFSPVSIKQSNQHQNKQFRQKQSNKQNIYICDPINDQDQNIFTSPSILAMINQFTKKQSQSSQTQQTPDFNAIHLPDNKLNFYQTTNNKQPFKKLQFGQQTYQTKNLHQKAFDKCYNSALFSPNSYNLFNSNTFQFNKTSSNNNSSQAIVKVQFTKGIYQGVIKNGIRNGYGTFYYKEGGKYSGYWYNNKMDGHGTLYYPDGRVAYQGQWQNDSLHGKGVLYNQNPVKIQGQYNYSCFEQCQEEESWISYDGWFQNDQKSGYGQLLLSNYEKFVGQFKNDMVHGKGKFYKMNGTIFEGTWQNNKLID